MAAMTGMVAIQAVCADVIGRALAGENLDRVLEMMVTTAAANLTPAERSAIHSISFDSLRHYGLLSAQLDTLLSQPANDAAVRHLLLVALAQLQFSKAAPHAIVDHAVTAAELMGYGRAKALVNAVLRNFLRAPEKFSRERFKLDVARYDFPRWWLKRMRLEYPDSWEPALLSARERPPMWLRVNRHRETVEGYMSRLAAQDLSATHHSDGAIQLERPMPVHELPGFCEGLVSVQDLGAQQSASLLGAEPGMRVLDACAAPGGKACHLLERTDLDLMALDSDARRLTRVADNLARLGLQATLKVADAAKIAAWWDKKPFDRILLDVPCSGSGVVRRHPDIKWGRRETDLARFAAQQTMLLDALWNCLGNGGRLLYATCSVFAIENGNIVEQFLRKTPNAQIAALPDFPLAPTAVQLGKSASPGYQLLPNHAHDGFYYALLEKVG